MRLSPGAVPQAVGLSDAVPHDSIRSSDESYRLRRDTIGTHPGRKHHGRRHPVRLSVGLSRTCYGGGDGGLDVIDGDVKRLGQRLECLPSGNSFGAPGLPSDVCGRRHMRSRSKVPGAESCGRAQASQVGRSPGIEEVEYIDVQCLGEAAEHFGPWGGTAQLPA